MPVVKDHFPECYISDVAMSHSMPTQSMELVTKTTVEGATANSNGEEAGSNKRKKLKRPVNSFMIYRSK